MTEADLAEFEKLCAATPSPESDFDKACGAIPSPEVRNSNFNKSKLVLIFVAVLVLALAALLVFLANKRNHDVSDPDIIINGVKGIKGTIVSMEELREQLCAKPAPIPVNLVVKLDAETIKLLRGEE